ncbi:MAG: hypothetical protein KIS92_13145 [Planctomycetota bacterium]|nr:hypothetical protein [Planctomycetota bacterium]
MRSFLCFFLVLAFVWNHAHPARAAETSYTDLLCTKADTAPEKVLGVLVLPKSDTDKNPSKIPPVLLVADGAVGGALADLLDKQATITVTGHAEGEYFRVTSVKTVSYAKDEEKHAGEKKEGGKDEGKDEAKTGADDEKGKKKRGKDNPKDPPKKKKDGKEGNGGGEKNGGKKGDEPNPGSVIVIPQ